MVPLLLDTGISGKETTYPYSSSLVLAKFFTKMPGFERMFSNKFICLNGFVFPF